MKIALVILIAALIAKDTSQLNDPYVMRGIAQGLCLFAGGVWLLSNFSMGILRSYWPIFGYMTALLVATTGAASPEFVLLQLLSLSAALLFFIAYFENQHIAGGISTSTLINASTYLYAFVALISLVVMYTHPGIAYGSIDNGDAGIEHRFRGLFPKAGMLASAVGVTIGLIWFSNQKILLKFPIIAICAACLFFTLSRTFWIALAGGVLATYWIYSPQSRKKILFSLLAFVPLFVAFKTFDISVDLSKAKFARTETITNLTGRVGLWEQGLKAFMQSPILGYGYTAGATGLNVMHGREAEASGVEAGRNVSKETMHSGYLQSLLDSGIVGTFFYLSILLVALSRLYRLDVNRQHRAEFFALVYFAIANITQNIIYSASVFDSLLFFALATFAMSLRGTGSHAHESSQESASIRMEKAV